MKPRRSNHRNQALTLVEVLVIITVLAILAAIILPGLSPHLVPPMKINCVNNLHQIGTEFRVWAGDNNDKYPMEISVTNGGTMELAATGDVVATFQVMSNELSTPKILICPNDAKSVLATNFGQNFGNSNVSYFIGLNANRDFPRAFLSGDDNFTVRRLPVKSGLLELSTDTPVAWTAARHKHAGNILFADGSVHQTGSSNLCQFLQQTGLATNRFAIP